MIKIFTNIKISPKGKNYKFTSNQVFLCFKTSKKENNNNNNDNDNNNKLY